jgi:hypothetical protein
METAAAAFTGGSILWNAILLLEARDAAPFPGTTTVLMLHSYCRYRCVVLTPVK